jgi:hypothetical protein
VKPAQFQGTEEYVPIPVVDLLKADVITRTGDRNLNPIMVPADSTVGADVAYLEAIGIYERRDLFGNGAERRGIDRSRGQHIEGFMGLFIIEDLIEAVKASAGTDGYVVVYMSPFLFRGIRKDGKNQRQYFYRAACGCCFNEVSDIRNEPTYNPNMISAELNTEGPI